MTTEDAPLAKKIKIGFITLLIVGAFLAITLHFNNSSYVKSIKANPKLTKGVIESQCLGRYSANDFNYTFTVNNKNYSGKYHTNENHLSIGTSFPVIYDSLDPSRTNVMLVLPSDYKALGFSYDSIAHILSKN